MQKVAPARGIEGQQAEQVEQIGRVRRGQILDPAKERLVAHFNGNEQHLIEREEHRNLKQDGQAAGGRVYLLTPVKRHHFSLRLLRIILVAFLELRHFGREHLHLGHGFIGLTRQREK